MMSVSCRGDGRNQPGCLHHPTRPARISFFLETISPLFFFLMHAAKAEAKPGLVMHITLQRNYSHPITFSGDLIDVKGSKRTSDSAPLVPSMA